MPTPKTLKAPKKSKVAKPEDREPDTRPVLFPFYEVLICAKAPADHYYPEGHPRHGETVEYEGPITVERAKQLLGWETEEDFGKRITDPNQLDDYGNPGNPLAKEPKRKYGNNYTLKDMDGNKVRCRNNAKNRNFDEQWSKKIAQDVLTRNWKMNLENIIISRYGTLLSGQHRLICLVLAWQEWKKQGTTGRWQTQEWKDEEPYIEASIAFGASEDLDVLRTFDNVKPRSLADVFYSNPIFRKDKRGKERSQADRNEMSKMLDYAVDLLWKRLHATDSFVTYQTHSASIDFFDRHASLAECVADVHELDGGGEGRCLSSLNLNTGHIAALYYLMAQSNTNEDRAETYHLTPEKREKMLNWDNWGKAKEFWTEMAKAGVGADAPEVEVAGWVDTVKEALTLLAVEGLDRGVTTKEKYAVIANAWKAYLDGTLESEKAEFLLPEFDYDEGIDKRRIIDEPKFGYADRGSVPEVKDDPKKEPDEGELSEKEKAIRAKVEKERAEASRAALEAAKTGKKPKKATTLRADPDQKVLPAKKSAKTAVSLEEVAADIEGVYDLPSDDGGPEAEAY